MVSQGAYKSRVSAEDARLPRAVPSLSGELLAAERALVASRGCVSVPLEIVVHRVLLS
jgi:hypothetical protein